METRWTSSEDLENQRYRYRDRYCWIDPQTRMLHLQEMLNTPHEGYEEVFHHVHRIEDFLAAEQLQEQFRTWFGSRSLGTLLAACQALLA